MDQYFLFRDQTQSGPFSIEELNNQSLNTEDRIFKEGWSDWEFPQNVRTIPPLIVITKNTEIKSKKAKKSSKIWFLAILILLTISGVVGIYYYYFHYHYTTSNKTLTAEEIETKYKNSVVLIKHGFLYKMKLGDTEYFFTSYDPSTGETSELHIDKNDLKNDVVFSYGTGFLIDTNGSILTNRHVVNPSPSKEDSQRIFN